MANIHWQVVYLRKTKGEKDMKFTSHSIKVNVIERNGRDKQNVRFRVTCLGNRVDLYT